MEEQNNNSESAMQQDGQVAGQTKPPKGSGGGVKLLLIGCVVLIFCLLTFLVAGTAFAYTSNKNVPVFSDVVETVEKVAVSDSTEDEMIQDDINDVLFSALLPSLVGDTTVIESDLSKEDLQSYIKDPYEAGSYRFDLGVMVDMGDSGSLDMGLVGYNVVDDNDKTQMSSDFEGTYNTTGLQVNFSGELRSTDNTLYAKVDEAPSDLIDSLGVDGSTVLGQWLKFDASSTTDLVGTTGLTDAAVVEESTLTRADLDKIQEFIYSDEMANTLERVDDEVIEGVRTRCFKMSAGPEDLVALMKKGAELSGTETDENELAESVEGLDGMEMYVCSGRKDGKIYKLEATISDTSGAEYKVIGKMWDYDVDFDPVEIPSDTLSLDELYNQLLQQQLQELYQYQDADKQSEDDLDSLMQEYLTDEEYQDYLDSYGY